MRRESRPLLRSATLESDLRPPTIEVVLRCLEVVDGDLHIIDLAVAFVDPLRLLLKLVQDKSELILNLHGYLKTDAVGVRQSFDCRPNRPWLGPMNSRAEHQSGSWNPADGDYSCRSRRSKHRRIRGESEVDGSGVDGSK